MNAIINDINRKLKSLNEQYMSHLRMVQDMVGRPSDIESTTFEQNMINHLVIMNQLKAEMNTLKFQLEIYKTINK